MFQMFSSDPLSPLNSVRPGVPREVMFQKWGEPRAVPGIPGSAFGLVDFMGSDQSVVRAARTSYGRDLSGHSTVKDASYAVDGKEYCKICHTHVSDPKGHCLPSDRNLIRYLLRHRHSTPLEVGGELVFYVKLPVFVERQWARHRTAGWSEMSARYIELPEEFYVPLPPRVRGQSQNNKQGSGDALSSEAIGEARRIMEDANEHSFDAYRKLLDLGLAKELARTVTPVATSTVKVWKCDLRNLLHFSGLRLHSHAQWEIRQYAQVIAEVIRDRWPLAWEAFYDYELHAHTFSRQEMDLLREIVSRAGDFSERATRRSLGDEFDIGTDREKKEFWSQLRVL